jgi:hypothetical protein
VPRNRNRDVSFRKSRHSSLARPLRILYRNEAVRRSCAPSETLRPASRRPQATSPRNPRAVPLSREVFSRPCNCCALGAWRSNCWSSGASVRYPRLARRLTVRGFPRRSYQGPLSADARPSSPKPSGRVRPSRADLRLATQSSHDVVAEPAGSLAPPHRDVAKGTAVGSEGTHAPSYRDFALFCSARAAPMAVFTCFLSSGGGSTAFRPRDSSHNSRHQPLL